MFGLTCGFCAGRDVKPKECRVYFEAEQRRAAQNRRQNVRGEMLNRLSHSGRSLFGSAQRKTERMLTHGKER